MAKRYFLAVVAVGSLLGEAGLHNLSDVSPE